MYLCFKYVSMARIYKMCCIQTSCLFSRPFSATQTARWRHAPILCRARATRWVTTSKLRVMSSQSLSSMHMTFKSIYFVVQKKLRKKRKLNKITSQKSPGMGMSLSCHCHCHAKGKQAKRSLVVAPWLTKEHFAAIGAVANSLTKTEWRGGGTGSKWKQGFPYR